ncbi:MAG: ERF family protein [Gallionella sp.]|jgi:hypothetical protein
MSLNLLKRINAVRKAISYIKKDRDVSTGGGSYKAVTHDAVTALVREHMVENGIVSWPNLIDSAMHQPFQIEGEKVNKQWRYEATYDFTFANVEDATDSLVIRIQAHAMDNADKAPGKALSYAKKYAMLKLFEIETGEDEESRYNPEGLDNDELAAHLKAINEAGNEVELKRVYTAAYQASNNANDKEATKLLIKTKDSRKKALTVAQNG